MESVNIRSNIGGDWVEGAGSEIVDVDPAHPDTEVGRLHTVSIDQVREAIAAAAAASPSWRGLPLHARGEILLRVAELLEERKQELARGLTREQGKIFRDSLGEVQRAAEVFRYNASLANLKTGEIFASPRPSEQIWSLRVPLGVVSLITPWNIPLAIPAWKLAPALLCGNAVVWKPASLVPLIAQRLTEILFDAGVPPGVCNLVLAGQDAARPLLTDPAIRACSFTGSTAVGQSLVALGAEHGPKVQAEMGGKNSAVILADADLEWAIPQVLSAAMLQSGQRCTATSRVIVSSHLYEEVVERLARGSDELEVGDGLEPGSDLGPLVSAQRQAEVLGYVAGAESANAHRHTKGPQVEGLDGFFVRPTVMTGVTAGDPIFEEEVFGPVLAVAPSDDFEEALRLANHGSYGLSGSVFTKDIGRILEYIERFDVGVLHVNSESCGADPHVPFGGTKSSGTSQREMGTAGLDFFSEAKTVYLRP
jgi:aldehyde dehydrogenase (NAD+)